MNIVLRHKVSGLYYQAAGKWVRRSDNACVFKSARAARLYLKLNQLREAQPVPRLAPYLMAMLHRPSPSIWQIWSRGAASGWDGKKSSHFNRN